MLASGKSPPTTGSLTIRAVTFDLDDTLWAIGPVIAKAEDALWGWLGAHCPRLSPQFDREGLLEIRAELLDTRPMLVHDISGLRLRILAEALERSGYPAREAARLATEAFAVFMSARHEVEYFEHVLEVLASLHRHYALGVLSNGNADIRRLDIGKYFDFAISSAGLASSKPEPPMFEAALRAAACAPQEMAHVGDHHEHDIAGARSLGIRTVWYNPSRKAFPGPEPANAEIATWDELPGVLARL